MIGILPLSSGLLFEQPIGGAPSSDPAALTDGVIGRRARMTGKATSFHFTGQLDGPADFFGAFDLWSDVPIQSCTLTIGGSVYTASQLHRGSMAAIFAPQVFAGPFTLRINLAALGSLEVGELVVGKLRCFPGYRDRSVVDEAPFVDNGNWISVLGPKAIQASYTTARSKEPHPTAGETSVLVPVAEEGSVDALFGLATARTTTDLEGHYTSTIDLREHQRGYPWLE